LSGGDDTAHAVALEAAYYQTIEEFFVSRRGPPLTIANADWTLVRKWHKAGIPLRVVLRGIADALDAHAHSFARAQPVGSLRYCEAEVDVACERWRRALAGAGPAEIDLGAALEALAAAYEAVARGGGSGLDARARVRTAEIAAALRERAEGPGARLDLETWLVAQEAELVKLVKRAAGHDEVARLEAEVDADLAPYRERLPARVLQQVRRDAVARRLLEEHGLPRLSLFQP
jgi:hypothetical protein